MPLSVTPQQWRIVERLFHTACDVPLSARAALVHREAHDHPEIERLVLRLLAADAELGILDLGFDRVVAELLSG